MVGRCTAQRRLSSVGQSDALVMRRSRVRFSEAAPPSPRIRRNPARSGGSFVPVTQSHTRSRRVPVSGVPGDIQQRCSDAADRVCGRVGVEPLHRGFVVSVPRGDFHVRASRFPRQGDPQVPRLVQSAATDPGRSQHPGLLVGILGSGPAASAVAARLSSTSRASCSCSTR